MIGPAGPGNGLEWLPSTSPLAVQVWRCRLTLSNPVLKAPMASALECDELLSTFVFEFNLRRHIQAAAMAEQARLAAGL